jgi:hypothetical protein
VEELMPELREVFEMTTKQMEPDRDAWREQETRHRRANRNKRVGGFSVAAAVGVAAIAVILATRADPNGTPPEPGVTADATAEEETAAGFRRSFRALDADGLITSLAPDADIVGLVRSLGGDGTEGTAEGLRLFISWLEAARYEQLLAEPCVETFGDASGTVVRCPFDFHLLGSREIGREPYSGSYLDLTVQGGKVVRAAMSWETGGFSPQMWAPFAGWVSAAYPNDAAVMYDDETYSSANLSEESIELWRQRVGEYVNEIGSGDPLSVGRNSRVVEGSEFSFTVPETGWEAFGSISINKSIVGPQDAEAIIFWTSFPDGGDAQADAADPCGQVLSSSIGSTTADLAAAVSTAPGTALVTGPSDVTVGGYPAKHVVLTVREDLGCDPGYFYSWQAMSWGAFWAETNPGDTISVWIVDVGGTLIFFEAETTDQADAELRREIEQIIGSISFD